MARETVFALRRQIARIEGTLPDRLWGADRLEGSERLEAPVDAGAVVVRRGGVGGGGEVLATGAARLDAALGGGLPKAALTEIHGLETRDAGAVSGFMLAVAGLVPDASESRPILWIGTSEILREAGFPYAGGLRAMFGLEPAALLFCEAGKLGDALWIAEEAVRLTEPSAVVLEVRGNPRRVDLTATRRLHARARATGRPLFLLRQAAEPEPTSAPLRLVVAPASSTLRRTIAGPVLGSIGRPAFSVTIDKGGNARSGKLTLEWNPDERLFEERPEQEKQAKGALPVVPLSRDGTDTAPAPGAVVALRPAAA